MTTGNRTSSALALLALVLAIAPPIVAVALERPNSHNTPGSVALVNGAFPTAAQIRVSGYARRMRQPYDSAWRQYRVALFQEYRLPHAVWNLYTIDHLIPIELGGRPFGMIAGRWDLRNVWPQPKAEAKEKDAVEDALHAAVCHRDGYYGLHLSLATAERAIAADWTQTPVGLPTRTADDR